MTVLEFMDRHWNDLVMTSFLFVLVLFSHAHLKRQR